MAKHQSRRSLSVRGSTYAAVRTYCADQGVSMSDLVEELIAARFRADKLDPQTLAAEAVKRGLFVGVAAHVEPPTVPGRLRSPEPVVTVERRPPPPRPAAPPARATAGVDGPLTRKATPAALAIAARRAGEVVSW